MTYPMPLVSIVIPTYKRESLYLGRALQSVIDQTHRETEILVVDDNPPDSDYRALVENLLAHEITDARITYIQNSRNLGGAMARNVGISAATGQYITFLDDDDEYLPFKIENQVRFMLERNLDLSFTDLKLVNTSNRIIDYRQYGDLSDFTKDALFKYHFMKHLTGTPTFMFKAQSLKAIGGFEDVQMGQEFYLMEKAIISELKIGYLPGSDVVAYRHQNGGISFGANKIAGELALYEHKKKFFNLFSDSEKRFIISRHYAVMSIAYLRNHDYPRAVHWGLRAVIASPIDSARESVAFARRIARESVK